MVVILVTRSAVAAAGRLVPALAAIGVLDMAGNALYILAVQAARSRSPRCCPRCTRS